MVQFAKFLLRTALKEAASSALFTNKLETLISRKNFFCWKLVKCSDFLV